MPSHEQVKYVKDVLSVLFMFVVGGYLAVHILTGGALRPVVPIAGVAS